jgi:hypothetical protein
MGWQLKRPAVVAFEEERPAVAVEECAQVCGDGFAVRIEGDERLEGVACGHVDDDNEEEPLPVAVFAVFGGVDGPREVGLVPADGLPCGALRAVSGLTLLTDPLGKVTPRDDVIEAAVECAGAAAAFVGVEQGFDFAADFLEGQRP